MNNFYSFVVPIYNEKKNIVPTIEVIEKYFINEKGEEIYIYDNNKLNQLLTPSIAANDAVQSIRGMKLGGRRQITVPIQRGYSPYVKENGIVLIDIQMENA